MTHITSASMSSNFGKFCDNARIFSSSSAHSSTNPPNNKLRVPSDKKSTQTVSGGGYRLERRK